MISLLKGLFSKTIWCLLGPYYHESFPGAVVGKIKGGPLDIITKGFVAKFHSIFCMNYISVA